MIVEDRIKRHWGVFAMINKMFAVIIAVALSLATSLLIPVEVAARGFGSHRSHTLLNRQSLWHHRHAYRHSPYRHTYRYSPFGGFGLGYASNFYTPYDYTPNYFIEPAGDVSLLQRIDPYIPPPPPLSCHHSQETVTVPSEDGGDRQIRITRC